jgi:REP element-mobilizing transposase RayT
MAIARSRLVCNDREEIHHCISRCVRRAFLCGRDTVTQRDYEHRKQWLAQRLKELARIFFIDVCGYSIMDNHLHVILRNRPTLAGNAGEAEVASRWWRLFPKRRNAQNAPEEPTDGELEMVLLPAGRVDELRTRLSSISWFMRCLKENIAKRANAEDKCTGRFWEGRFKSIALLDQAAVLACSAYVDLNPIRAGIAESPETSEYTSARDRIVARQARKRQAALVAQIDPAELKDQMERAQWLCPLKNQPNRRGFLDMALDDYLELLDWTGRQIVEGKKGAIPAHLQPILTRLAVDPDQWIHSSQHFGSMFYRVAGKVTNMTKRAMSAGQKWLKGREAGKRAFLTG